jgi:hypothetical protein
MPLPRLPLFRLDRHPFHRRLDHIRVFVRERQRSFWCCPFLARNRLVSSFSETREERPIISAPLNKRFSRFARKKKLAARKTSSRFARIKVLLRLAGSAQAGHRHLLGVLSICTIAVARGSRSTLGLSSRLRLLGRVSTNVVSFGHGASLAGTASRVISLSLEFRTAFAEPCPSPHRSHTLASSL